MQVKPVASPTAIQQAPSNAVDAKARAVAAFTAGQAQPPQQQVSNQNQVAPEEMSALNMGQDDSNVVTEDTVIETPVIEKTEDDPQLTKQYEQLARQERAIRARAKQQETALRTREAALQAREQELATKDSTYKTGYISKDQFLADPLGTMAEAGLTYDDLVSQLVNQQPVDPRLKNTISKLEQEIKDLKSANENAQKSYQENQTQAYQAAVKQIQSDAAALVRQDPNFETIKATNSVQDVVDLITATYDQDGILLTVEEAALEVEEYLVNEGLKIAQISKIQKRMAANVAQRQPTSTAQTPAAKQPQQTQQMKTLTNSTGSTRQMSAKERAILAFKGELKS